MSGVETVLGALNAAIASYERNEDNWEAGDREVYCSLVEARVAISAKVEARDELAEIDEINRPNGAVRHCANVVVHRGEPPGSNPYRGTGPRFRAASSDPYTHVDGDERVEALHAFNTGEPPSEYTYWWAPVGGGAYRLVPGVYTIIGLR